MSSANPNLQNIPVVSELGREIRKAFIAEEGHRLVSFDYSQIELRVAAHLADDKKMIVAFRRGLDIHKLTASEIFNIPIEKVGSEERRAAKTLNFGILYGMGPQALAESTGMGREEARKFIEEYFHDFLGIKKYVEETKRFADENGYVETLFGRRRYIPEIHSPNWQLKREAERMAVNMPVQGCLPYKTKILTSKGYIPIGELYDISSRVRPKFIWDGSQWRKYKVLNRGQAQLAEISLQNGQKLECDIRHIVLTVNEAGYTWKKFNELRRGDRICCSLPRIQKFESAPGVRFKYEPSVANGLPLRVTGLDEEFWYWIGYYYGDGWLSKRIIPHKNNYERIILHYVFGHREEEKLKQCRQYFIKLGFRPWTRRTRPTTSRGHHRFILGIESRGLGLLLKKVGLSPGATAKTKRLPQRIYGESLGNRIAFLRGMLDSDGWYGRNSHDVATIHLPQRYLLEDMFLLLKTVGVPGKIRGPYKNGEQISHRLDIPYTFVTERILGIPRKHATKAGRTTPPFLIKEFLERYPRLPKKFFSNDSDYIEYRRWHRGGSCSIYFFEGFLKRYDLSITSPVYDFSEVNAKRVFRGWAETFTLSVEDSCRFDSEGVISKNTATGDIIKLAMIKVSEWLKKENLENDVRLLLQVHDELLFEIKKEATKRAASGIKNIMEAAAELKVPLVVDVKAGPNWGEQKEI